MAVSLPNDGEMNLMIIPEMKYQPTTKEGPCHPTNSASFLENRTISKTGFVIFKYKLESDWAHFSAS